MITWTKDKATMDLENQIARRAVKMAIDVCEGDFSYKQMDALMDIDACHSNGCPLKLQELLETNDVNFAHDVFGIRRHIDRTTGKLQNCFLPRYAA